VGAVFLMAVPVMMLLLITAPALPPKKAGAASAVSETSGEFGIAMGIAIYGSLATAIHRGDLTVPAQVPAGAAAGSMAGAANVAGGLNDQLAASLLAPAREAFTSGPHVVAGIGAAIVVVFAVAGMIALRGGRRQVVEPTTEQGTEEPVLVS